jgi:2-dehydro-3-deoxyphosphogluconate aldolase/(4S)-4-hydroxy-2-oxoglutarate aldolase
VAVGAGGALTKGSSEDITKTAKAFVNKIKEARESL